MKQIILPFNTGRPRLEDVPAPAVQPGHVLIRTTASVVSSGTERMLMNFGKAGWIGKVRQQPEKVRQVLDKIKTDGLSATLHAVHRKLDQPIALGYSQAGVVLAVGDGVSGLQHGDRVASNGTHAEIVSVPRNLVAKIPEGVPDEAAAFTVLGAIALQGIRLVQPTFGETVVVYGLGLIGQLTAQLLMANGCRVIGMDLYEQRLQVAAGKGVVMLSDASADAVRAITGGHGADAVIITASSKSDAIIATAADMCRKRGRIVLTGVVGLQLQRDHFFKKELSFQVSASYGPGRYEPAYEAHGLDYPIGYVRWTEGRNLEAVLQAMASGRLDVAPLITTRAPLHAFAAAYEALDDLANLAAVFTYSSTPNDANIIRHPTASHKIQGDAVAIIGAGNFTAAMLLPALKKAGADIATIISKSGLSAATLARKWAIPQAGTDYALPLGDKAISAVIITTPHHTHAAMTIAALQAGKDVLVEKPLALSRAEAAAVQKTYLTSGRGLTVGFNRRVAPLALQAKSLMDTLAGPMHIIITVNAGHIPKEHWIQDALIGGGRILGEACHFIDLCSFFAGAPVIAVCANSLQKAIDYPTEDVSVLLRLADGSAATVHYFSNGSKAYDKERVELYRADHTVIIENWRTMRGYGFRKKIVLRCAQDKGHTTLVTAWIDHLRTNSQSMMNIDEIMNSTLAIIAVTESLAQGGWISV